MNVATLFLFAALALLLAATCSRVDELNCKPPEKPYHCAMECMARPCDSPFAYEPRRAQAMFCAVDSFDALMKFAVSVREYDVKDCSPPECRSASDTGSALMPNGSPSGGSFHEQAETESGATGGFWEPVPGGSGCVP